MKKYNHIVKAYRLHSMFKSMENEANRIAKEAIDNYSTQSIKLVQTYRPLGQEALLSATDKKHNKIILQFYKNIIIPRRVILLFLYQQGYNNSMEQYCKFLGGAEPEKYFDVKANIWGCTKLKKAMQILGFGFHVTRQVSALKVLDLPLSKNRGDFLQEEQALLNSYSDTEKLNIDESIISRHIGAISLLLIEKDHRKDSWEDRYRNIMSYLRDHHILEDKHMANTLAEHFRDKNDTTSMPRILLY